MGRPIPAFKRLDVDERRRRLLELGEQLFAEHSYDELSMAQIARRAGISKALLYHYFPSKQAYFVATLQQAASELEALVEPDPQLSPAEQLEHSLDAFLAWIEERPVAYRKLLRSAAAVAEVGEVIETVRHDTAAIILAGLWPEGAPPPALRAAVSAWLWFMDGACLDWIEHGDMSREELRGLLMGALLGAIAASGQLDVAGRLGPRPG